MVSEINRWIMVRSSGRNLLVFFALYLIMFAVFGQVLVPAFQAVSDGLYPIDMSPIKSPAAMYQQFAHYSQASKRIYTWFFALDFIYPPTLAACFALLWAWLTRRFGLRFPQSWFSHGLLLLPFVAAFLDWTENVGFLTMILDLPARHDTIALVSGLVNYIKLGILTVCMLVSLVLAGAAIFGPNQPSVARTR